MRKTTGCWLVLAIATVAMAAGLFYFQVSWVNPYGEAEALQPVASELALELSAATEGRAVAMDDLRALLKKEQYAELRSCSFTLPDDLSQDLLTMRINRRFGLSLHRSGQTTWIDYKRKAKP